MKFTKPLSSIVLAFVGFVSCVPVQAQYNYLTNGGTITITRYTGSGDSVSIPSTINGRFVTRIGPHAFDSCANLTNITIPYSVTSIGNSAFGRCSRLASITLPDTVASIEDALFSGCTSLTSVTIPNSVTNIGNYAFSGCVSLTSITIPKSVNMIGGESSFSGCYSLTNITILDGVTRIGQGSFISCVSLMNVTIPNSVTNIGVSAFSGCTSMIGIYFQGDQPNLSGGDFGYSYNITTSKPTVYYLPGTKGWGPTFGGCTTAVWKPQTQASFGGFGVQTNQFGFTIKGTSNMVVVVEASTNLGKADWSPVGTNTLTGGSSYFYDPQWTKYPESFYRLRLPQDN